MHQVSQLRTKEILNRYPNDEYYLNIVQHNQPYIHLPMCKNWGIDPRDLITGVQCGKCERFGMEELKKGWNCLSCGNINRQALESSVRDLFGLVNSSYY